MSTRTRCSTCNLEWPADTAKCYKCGQALRAGVGGPSGLYAETGSELELLLGGGTLGSVAGGAYCDGSKLVLVEGEGMPRRCPICNSDDVSETTDLSIERGTKEMGGVSGMVKAGMDLVGGWNYTGPVEVSVYFCDRHRARFRNRLILASVILLISALYLVVAYLRYKPDSEFYDVLVAVIGAATGVVMLLTYAKSPALAWFKPYKFVDRTVWVTGAGRPFLDSLPSWSRNRR